MTSVTIQEAQAKLRELILGLAPGAEVIITENDRPIAIISPTSSEPPRKKRKLGTMKGSVLYVAPDFDAPLEEFEEYNE